MFNSPHFRNRVTGNFLLEIPRVSLNPLQQLQTEATRRPAAPTRMLLPFATLQNEVVEHLKTQKNLKRRDKRKGEKWKKSGGKYIKPCFISIST